MGDHDELIGVALIWLAALIVLVVFLVHPDYLTGSID